MRTSPNSARRASPAHLRPRLQGRRGGALVASLIAVMVLSGLASAIFAISLAHNREVIFSGARLRSLYMADAGVSESLSRLAAAVGNDLPVPIEIGTYSEPIGTPGGRFWCRLDDNGDGSYTVTSTGRSGFVSRRLQAVFAPSGGSVYHHAVFAGNSSGDPAYVLGFGGLGAQADAITGNIYSGNDVSVGGDATVAGTITAGGTIAGAAGSQNETRPLPDVQGMDYANTADFDVAALFAGATVQSSPVGGDALQVPEANPAHIFRKNPDDRDAEISGTTKDDYFLEDPYEPLQTDADQDGTDAHPITLSGTGGEVGPDGNGKLYYIDGNLWIHNNHIFSFAIDSPAGTGAQVTFVVRGNIYFADNVFYANPDLDGVAFIAMQDELVADSGNIYFGDPAFGTLQRMYGFLYAENDFYDYNLDAEGSDTVRLVGNMTAGNHVSIQRDSVGDDGVVEHSKLTVDFDDRILSGDLELPGLPRMSGAGVGGFRVVFWKEIGVDA